MIDFGSKVLNDNVRVTQPFADIYVIEPYSDMRNKLRGPRAQAEFAVHAVRRMAKDGLIRTVIWDTITNTAREVTSELAYHQVNKDDHSKNYAVDVGEGHFLNTPGVNWRDNGMAQNFCRYSIRDALIKAPEPFDLIMIGHEVRNNDEGLIGVDIAGKAAAANFPGGKFSAFLNMVVAKDGNRYVLTKSLRKEGLTRMAIFKPQPGTSLAIADDNGMVKVPENDFDGCVSVWKALTDALAADPIRVGLYGEFDTGKSALASAYLGLPGKLPAVVVMSDSQSSLPTYWPQVKADLNKETSE